MLLFPKKKRGNGLFLWWATAREVHLVDDFGREGEFGNDIFFGREAIEGVVACGEVDAIEGLDMGKIVLYM